MNTYEIIGEGDRGVLILKGEFGIESAVNLKQALLDAMEKYPRLSVDLKDVTGGDCSFLQTLHSARLTLRARGEELGRVSSIPEAVRALAHGAGFLQAREKDDFWRGG
jgi:anti-anti-sigma regulatory factor